MRSALNVLSLSTSAPQMAMILSASLAAAAATQGAGSTCGSVTGSALVARACCGGAAQSIQAIATRKAAVRRTALDVAAGLLIARREPSLDACRARRARLRP